MRKKNHFVNGETTIIGEGSVIDGNFKTTASTRIDGIIYGDVSSDGVIIVGTSGKVNGNIVAMEVRNAGDIRGNVKAPDKIELVGKATLYGNIETKSLSIEEQAIFQGNCLMDNTVVNNNVASDQLVNATEEKTLEIKNDMEEENVNESNLKEVEEIKETEEEK